MHLSRENLHELEVCQIKDYCFKPSLVYPLDTNIVSAYLNNLHSPVITKYTILPQLSSDSSRFYRMKRPHFHIPTSVILGYYCPTLDTIKLKRKVQAEDEPEITKRVI
jgi:hypothetical protein